jgi:MoaA/NifB/PqqE/SkfB family radical SAM enzyme
VCRDSLKRRGANKVHWECWSECNLPCTFCYRTKGEPLRNRNAERLLAAVVTAGARTLTFAGGDPSLHPDIAHLLATARAIGLNVEVHTNAHFTPPSFRQGLAGVHWVGLSLDGPTAEVHDRFRGTRGNFTKVLDLLGFLDRAGVPVIVRTVVARSNYQRVAEIGDLLLPYANVASWYLLEFSAVGEGHHSRGVYELKRELFNGIVVQVVDRYADKLDIEARRSEDKSAAYVMITPGGEVYGTSDQPVDGKFPTVGSILRDHLSELVGKIKFNSAVHEPRYKTVERKMRDTRTALAQRIRWSSE